MRVISVPSTRFRTGKTLLLSLRFRTKKHLAGVSFYNYDMPEDTCYVKWLIGVEAGRLLGDQQ
ncbi:hypothetical protein ACQKMV_18430 [Lysinibacillus sp. NPDC094403]|uniref:hypothetical protein n=1 Tax=Lysinibacillus sp. NPDC094403 TaxID=3390581 RepID=UPI003CFCFC10